MARRRNSSPIEDFVGVIARLPWWSGVALALSSYLVFHWLAKPVAAAPLQPGQLGGAIYRSVLTGVASAAQYLVPILCLGAAIVSAVGRGKRASLVDDVAQSPAADALDGMSWQDFEMLVGEGYRLQGYEITETGGGGADGGVDLVLRKGSEKFLVQCKQWNAYKVGVQPVRELYGIMAARGAVGGYVVTSGRFTEEARRFASGRNLTLVDGPKLRGMIERARAATAAKGSAVTPARIPASAAVVAPAVAPTLSETHACPVCSRGMVLRTARRGANAGTSFWGCSGYPACKGTRPA